MALYDLAAKHAGLPLYKYLGGSIKDIESDLTIGIDTPQNMADTAAKFINDGVRMIKVKLGKDPATDIARIQKIREAVGSNIILRIDANQGWSYDEAVTALTGLGAYDIQFCEQPMRTWNDHLLPALCTISPIAIMADESVYTHHDAERIIESKACASINIKLAKSGGIKEALAINKVAEAAGIPCMLGGMLESRLALSAKVHLAMSLDNVKYYDLDTCLLGHKIDPVAGGAIYKGMHLSLDDAPGIGADVDPAFLQTLEQVVV
jgi:L-alanine-DL-glutamate epimerase-like enolase superfamily enzyme